MEKNLNTAGFAVFVIKVLSLALQCVRKIGGGEQHQKPVVKHYNDLCYRSCL